MRLIHWIITLLLAGGAITFFVVVKPWAGETGEAATSNPPASTLPPTTTTTTLAEEAQPASEPLQPVEALISQAEMEAEEITRIMEVLRLECEAKDWDFDFELARCHPPRFLTFEACLEAGGRLAWNSDCVDAGPPVVVIHGNGTIAEYQIAPATLTSQEICEAAGFHWGGFSGCGYPPAWGIEEIWERKNPCVKGGGEWKWLLPTEAQCILPPNQRNSTPVAVSFEFPTLG